MGYQALLFCPDEKTARTVTQVLSELDFEVVPCTEPFAAVKKLMAEHFDAVVVDCDNEQNATLLFKSARNAPNNQSALAVAVVEGQAGVAKAFRIGANLVLTKPMNVEQAKGTLRVARGLLRKGEAAKPAAAATSATPKPVPTAPVPAKPAQTIPSAASRPVSPIAPLATAPIPAPKPAPQKSFAASASSAISESGESTKSIQSVQKQTATASMTAGTAQTPAPNSAPTAASEPKPEIAPGKLEIPAPSSRAFSIATSAGAASAPARAREVKPSVPTADESLPVISVPQSPVEDVAAAASNPLAVETASDAATLTFGGTVGSGAEAVSGGSKKILLAVAVIALIAVGAYVAWTQYGPSNGAASVPAPAASRQVTAAPVAPQAVPSVAVSSSSTPSSTVSVPSSSRTSATPSSTAAAQPNGSTQTSSTSEMIPSMGNKQAHPSKSNAEADSPKPEAAVVAANKAPATAAAQPIVIKNGNSQPVVAKALPTADAAAPSITGIAVADNGGSLPNLMDGASKAPTPVLQAMSVSQGVSQGLVIKKTQPSYPASALRMHIEGSVQLLATISKTGDISAVKILNGDQGLARAAVDAVKQWKYKPYLLDGNPVEIQTQITVNFKLPR